MRGTATETNRSRNSYIRAPRNVTEHPIGTPWRRLKFAIAFLDRLARLDRDPLNGAVLVPAAPHARRLARLGIQQHHVRRRDRRGKLDDPALPTRLRCALVLLHDVDALHHDPKPLGVDMEDFPFLAPVLAPDHADSIAFAQVQLVTQRLPAPDAAALLVDQRLHVR